jgi:hypothetical protein
MRHPDDYRDEMDRLDPRMVDAALEGRETGDPALDRAAELVADVRHVLLAHPGPETMARHVAAMTAAARKGDRGFRPIRRPGRPGRRGLRGAALAAALVVGAGVAGAVTLPDRAPDRADQAVTAEQGRAEGGVETVEPAGEPAPQSAHGQEVADVAHDDSLQGCEKGQAVSDVASSNADGHRGDDPAKADPCARGQSGSGGGGLDASAGGQTTSQEAQAGDHGPPESAGTQADQSHSDRGQGGQGPGMPDQAGGPNG